MMKKPLKPKPGPTSASTLKPFVIMTYRVGAFTSSVQSKIAEQFTLQGYTVLDVPLSGNGGSRSRGRGQRSKGLELTFVDAVDARVAKQSLKRGNGNG